MADNDQNPKIDLEFEEPPAREGRWFKFALIALLVAIFVGIGAAIFTRGDRDLKRGAVQQLEQELNADLAAIKAKQDWLTELSRQLESAKVAIESGQMKGQKVIDEYKALAAQQRQERDNLLKMREAYNVKVFKLQEQQK